MPPDTLTSRFARFVNRLSPWKIPGPLRVASEYPKGDPENSLTQDELFSKFRRLTRGHLSPTAAETLIERCMNLEKASDVGKLPDFWGG